MATAVHIEVVLDEQGVVQGGAEDHPGHPKRAGQRGNLVFTRMAKEQEKARDASQFLSRSLGVEIPRSLEKVIARSQISVTHSNDGGSAWNTAAVDSVQHFPFSVDSSDHLAIGPDGTLIFADQLFQIRENLRASAEEKLCNFFSADKRESPLIFLR